MMRPPIFLYTSWRTGGTALALALKKDNLLFYDPLNPSLLQFQSAKDISSDSWSSNHPSGFNYFEEYVAPFSDGKLDYFPDLKNYKFRNSSETFQNELVGYLSRLLEHADSNNKTAVFKFEQLEGHVDVLKRKFPQAIHIALIRDLNDQYNSWSEQLALGNSYFFDVALNLIDGDPEFFKEKRRIDKPSHEEIFDIYQTNLLTLRSEFDATLDIYKDSKEKFIDNLPSEYFKKLFKKAFLNLEFLENQPTSIEKFARMRNRAFELTQQRDELTQQRDELTQQRDELTQQRDELIQQRDELTQQRDELIQQRDALLNSTAWRLTRPLRLFMKLLKR
jgi:hypothetical protein